MGRVEVDFQQRIKEARRDLTDGEISFTASETRKLSLLERLQAKIEKRKIGKDKGHGTDTDVAEEEPLTALEKERGQQIRLAIQRERVLNQPIITRKTNGRSGLGIVRDAD